VAQLQSLDAKEGAKVAFTGRREAEGQQTLKLVQGTGGDDLFLESDVSKAADVQSAVQKTVEKYGRLDVAFNNAGVEGVWVPLAEQTEENWDYVHGINLKGVRLCLKYEIQQMLKQGGGGAIVNMSSVAGWIGSPIDRITALLPCHWSRKPQSVPSFSLPGFHQSKLHANAPARLTFTACRFILRCGHYRKHQKCKDTHQYQSHFQCHTRIIFGSRNRRTSSDKFLVDGGNRRSYQYPG
jgi:NAD(P)-dependent dehydrogenase (short-subunit alcohol dehydrogenase family)